MPTWLEDYVAALDQRDARELANASTIQAYTRLADRTAALEAAAREAPEATENQPAAAAASSGLPARMLGGPRSTPPSSQESSNMTSLRADLATAHRNKALLEMQLSTVTTQVSSVQGSLKEQEGQAAMLRSQVGALEKEKASLLRKLRDRDSELKEKARLVENVQDEMLGLEMQTNMAEQRAEKLQKENTELVERWMKRMGKEADRMNEGSGWK